MPAADELASVIDRSGALRVLTADALLERCELAVFHANRESLCAPGSLSRMRLTGSNGSTSIEGAPGNAALSAVSVFDRVAGYVVAVGPPAAGRNAPRRVADRAAVVLGDLCAREYELNDLSREILSSYEELNLFYDLTTALAGAPDPESICAAVLTRAGKMVSSRAGRILIGQSGSARFRIAASYGIDADAFEMPRTDEGVAGRVFHSRQAEIMTRDELLSAADRDAWELTAGHVLVTVPVYVPARDDSSAIGVMQLVDRDPAAHSPNGPERLAEDVFSSGDLKLAQALASQAALLIENSRLIGYEREMRIARTIQRSLLPAKAPEVEGLEVMGVVSAAKKVGGDYYDLMKTPDGRLAVTLADVSGHDLAAALIQTAARSTFRAAVLTATSPAAVIDGVNRALIDDLSRAELFVTAWYASVDGVTGELTFGDAGHHPALLYRAAGGEIEKLDCGGLPLGVCADGLYREASVHLEEGDVVVAYTDGLSETRVPDGEEQYGDERVAESLARAGHLPVPEIVARLLEDVDRFGGGRPAADDRTLLVLKRTAGKSR